MQDLINRISPPILWAQVAGIKPAAETSMLLNCITGKMPAYSIDSDQAARGGAREFCCRKENEMYHGAKGVIWKPMIAGITMTGGSSRMANTDGMSFMTCLQVLIWFCTIARGRGFGLPDDEDMPAFQGSLTPSDARLTVKSARAMQTVFLLMTIKCNFVSRNYSVTRLKYV